MVKSETAARWRGVNQAGYGAKRFIQLHVKYDYLVKLMMPTLVRNKISRLLLVSNC